MTGWGGTAGGLTTVVRHGPNGAKWNLVVLGDGYTASQLPTFRTDVSAFVTALRATPPFKVLWNAVNVHRIDITSTESGADDPCGTGTTRQTYFNATFCADGEDRRLTVDWLRAKLMGEYQLGQPCHAVLVIVNHVKYGGAGGPVAVCSKDPQAFKIAIHEIGHTAFKLADEYEGKDSLPAKEPGALNVTTNANRATNKWRNLIDPSTPVPSTRLPNCAGYTSAANTPLAAGTVGVFEGARNSRCGVYRPAATCYMRDLRQPFCRVCSRVIRDTLAPYL